MVNLLRKVLNFLLRMLGEVVETCKMILGIKPPEEGDK